MARTKSEPSLIDPTLVSRAALDSFRKLNPRHLMKNPVIFVTEVVAAVVTVAFVVDITHAQPAWFSGQIAVWLWFTVLFANFAEAIAEGRGRAQADTLRQTRTETRAKRLLMPGNLELYEGVTASDLEVGDLVRVDADEIIPTDGEIVEGVASVNEAAVTGETAPVIRESGGDRSAVTGGTTVISDWLIVRVTAASGSSFLDRMIALVEGAERQKTPNELALSILLSGMTLIFLIAVVTLWPLASYSGTVLSITVLTALLVTLIPTTIGGLLSAIGIAGMDRLLKFNVLAMSGRAVEAAGDVDTLLLDKTGTITFGNRLASEIIPVAGVSERDLANAAMMASLADETAEGRSIVALTTEKYGVAVQKAPADAKFIEFSATTRLSGVDTGAHRMRKGAIDAILKFTRDCGGDQVEPPAFRNAYERIARSGGTPLGLADGNRLLGVIHLKDVVKPDIKERFAELRRMGIRTVMVTGDNPVTAAAIASASAGERPNRSSAAASFSASPLQSVSTQAPSFRRRSARPPMSPCAQPATAMSPETVTGSTMSGASGRSKVAIIRCWMAAVSPSAAWPGEEMASAAAKAAAARRAFGRLMVVCSVAALGEGIGTRDGSRPRR